MTFNKGKKQQPNQCLSSILDVLDDEVIIIQKHKNIVLFLNTAAKRRFPFVFDANGTSKTDPMPKLNWLFEKHPDAKDAEQACTFEAEDGSGKIFQVKSTPLLWDDNKPAFALFLRDISQERQAKQYLYNLAYVDQLTGISNRQKFKEDFDCISKDIAAGLVCGVVTIFDLDNFKNINDTYGHNTGDIMLRRLTEQLQSDEAFKGQLYRLGGDEFVLFYHEAADKFSTEEALREHFYNLLSGALMSYTMPNIDLQCTLSMGVSFFPKHGEICSELLRKADIALYKAKSAGRNRVMFFEDRYDTSKKFKNIFINMRPILTSKGETFGYTLTDVGDDTQDEGVMTLTEFNRALDVLCLDDMDASRRYFIPFTNQLLDPAVLKNLPREVFVVQFNVPATLSKKELKVYQQLRANGYSLLMSDLHSTTATQEILNLADYCEFSPEDKHLSLQKRIIESNSRITFIASQIDSEDKFQVARQSGFKLFEGYFFSQPSVTRQTKEVDPMRANYFKLIKLTSTNGYVDFREISAIISADVALSYKLLKLLNSASVGLRNISSIGMAVAYLGEENLKKWIGLLALRGIANDKPLELVRMSLIRAQFGELLAPHFRIKRNPKHVFLMGMLSLLHIALDKTREELFEEIPVADEIRQSLLTKNGVYSDLLSFYENYEYANWEEITRFADANYLDSQMINDLYISAVKWYNDIVND